MKQIENISFIAPITAVSSLAHKAHAGETRLGRKNISFIAPIATARQVTAVSSLVHKGHARDTAVTENLQIGIFKIKNNFSFYFL